MREIKNEYLHMSKNEYLHENNQNLNKNGSMATMAEKMVASLEELRKLQEKDRCHLVPPSGCEPLQIDTLPFGRLPGRLRAYT